MYIYAVLYDDSDFQLQRMSVFQEKTKKMVSTLGRRIVAAELFH